MNFACAAVFGINTADFGCQYKTHRTAAAFRNFTLEFFFDVRFEFEKSRFGRLKFLFEFRKPERVSEVSRGKYFNAFELSPLPQVFQVHLFASGAGVFAMKMKVADEKHGAIIAYVVFLQDNTVEESTRRTLDAVGKFFVHGLQAAYEA